MFENTVPPRYETASISRDITAQWNPTNFDTAASFLKGFRGYAAEGKAPLFAGKSGTGKTYSAAAIVNTLLTKMAVPPTVLWAPVAETFEMLTSLRDYRAELYWHFDGLLRSAEILVLDDFAHLRDYPRLRELFWIYVNARHDRRLPTIFTANLNMENGWAAIDEVFGEPYRRRIQSMTEGLVAVT